MSWTILALPTFLKDLARLLTRVREQVETFAFETLPESENPLSIQGVKKLKRASKVL